MLRVFEIRLPLNHPPDAIPDAIARALDVPLRDLQSWEIRRRAIDARKRTDIRITYSADVSVAREERFLREDAGRRIIPAPDESYQPVSPGHEPLRHRPVIVGSGPAGLFAALVLAQAGYRPIVLERGKPVHDRCRDVERFWRDGVLDPESNAQFGEGGAGTFSDGKLTTLIHDRLCHKVLREFVDAGAPSDLLITNRPHIGADRLRLIVRALRESIVLSGGEVRFGHRVTGLEIRDGRLAGLHSNGREVLECGIAVLAIGHSARDTFRMLKESGIAMASKPFSIGLRIEHPQQLIDKAQFGLSAGHPRLGAAEYKLAYHADNGRSAYTFCMCPGGEVIAAASEEGGVVTNGMSELARNGQNANSAIMVGVTPADFPGDDPCAGFEFQRQWERAAFAAAGGTYAAPAQLLADFNARRASTHLGAVLPTYRPGVVPSDLRQCLPEYACDTIKKAVRAFSHQLKGFDLPHAVMTGVETRSSCPVRLTRGDDLQSTIGGVYPAGEGAGYAGGIMSAAVDGIRVAEAIIGRYAPPG